MIFSIYLTMAAAFVAISSDNNTTVKIIAYIVLVIASIAANCSYYKLKKEVERNSKFLDKTGNFLLVTSSRVIDLIKMHRGETQELETATNNYAGEQEGKNNED